ncbi:MAG: hypothetical protein LBL52_02755, partial [Rickettsiales bacterium]|nr:hypothetical protein [Rickettsiales bacterium]
MTKLPRIFLLTCVLVLPIAWWLAYRWGMRFDTVSVPLLQRVFRADAFLRSALVINSALYIVGFIRILFAGTRTPLLPMQAVAARADNGAMNFRPPNSAGQIDPKDKRWQTLYSDKKMTTAAAPAPIVEAKADEPAPMPAALEPEPPAPAPDNVISLAETSVRRMYRTKISAFLTEHDYASFGPATIDGIEVDFIGCASDDTFVVGIVDSTFGEITANEEMNLSSSASWYSAEKKYPSPVWRARQALDGIKAMMGETLPPDSGVEVSGFVVVPNARIVNADDVAPKWAEAGISVVKFENYTDMQDLADALPDRSGTKPLESFQEFVEAML